MTASKITFMMFTCSIMFSLVISGVFGYFYYGYRFFKSIYIYMYIYIYIYIYIILYFIFKKNIQMCKLLTTYIKQNNSLYTTNSNSYATI